MAVLLHPTPRRIHITRENLELGSPAILSLPAEAGPEITSRLREELEEQFPDLDPSTDEETDGPVLRFVRFDEAGSPEEVPPSVLPESFRLVVSPTGIEAAAASPTGWLHAARLLTGLRERDELVGIELLDWPSFLWRQVDLVGSADTWSEAALRQCLGLLARARFNRLGLTLPPERRALDDELRVYAEQLGITLVEPAKQPNFRLSGQPTLFPQYSSLLPVLQEAAQAAAADNQGTFVLSLGAVDAETSLEALAYGVLFAGDCAWNPQKADLKSFRRWYSVRRFGFESRAPVQAIDELEAGASQLRGPDGSDLSAAVEAEDPFQAPVYAGILQPEERAGELGRRAAAGMAALGPLQPESEERVEALLGLQWTAQRLKVLSRRLLTAEKVRDLYRAAYVAAASPKAVSQRLLRAAELLENEAKALEQQRLEWHAFWKRERRGPYHPETESRHRARVASFQDRSAHLKELRDRYIQTGVLPSPAEEGLERPGTRLASGLQPGRLPPQPSPPWWPEGGAARLRIEVESPEEAAGIPWEVEADFRALAGETGAFNVRSVRLLPLTETDEAGPERPCQLLRSGFAFIAEPGRHTYFLYLDPQPGPDAGFRETRTSQSRAGVRLDNRCMQLRLSATHGFISAWRLQEPDVSLIVPEEELEEEEHAAEWRLRVLETGPLLARVRAEHADGRMRQLDLKAGQSWAELTVNAPWTEFLLPGRAELWPEEAVALFGVGDTVERWPLTRTAAEVAEASWAAQHRPDGLTLAALLPDDTAHATVPADGIRLWGRPHVGRVLMYGGLEQDPGIAFHRLIAAHRKPPRVRLGVVEERRVLEF